MTTKTRPALMFLRHLAEMLAAMAVGMVTLYPLWRAAVGAAGSPAWADRTEVSLMMMATTMSVAMAAWMLFRGHRIRPIAEMCAGMYAAFAVLFPLYWAGAMDDMGVMMWGHVLMPVFMTAVMVARRGDYTHLHAAAS